MSLAELAYMTGKSQAAIKDQLETLIEAGILAQYTYEPSQAKRDLPSQFYENTRKTEKIERHESAPRPDLPAPVVDALEFDEPTIDPQ